MVTFLPDPEIFEETVFDFSTLKHRFREMAFLTKGLKIIAVSLVAQQTRLREWAELVKDCQNRPQGMKIDEWCQLHHITKASYYWRLRKVREAFLETAGNS